MNRNHKPNGLRNRSIDQLPADIILLFGRRFSFEKVREEKQFQYKKQYEQLYQNDNP